MRLDTEGGAWWQNPTVAGVAAVIPAMLGVFLVAHELTLHYVLSGITSSADGMNFASALELSKGQLANSLPSLAATAPPGLAIILAPLAAAGHSSTAAAMTEARVLTSIVAVIDVFLVAFSARRHGLAAVVVAGTIFALFPYSFYATVSVSAGPYLVLFCLCGLMVAFDHGELATGRRLVVAGLLLGYGVTISPWALVPAAALLVCACVQWRECLGRVAAGVAIGIALPCAAFVASAPGAFWHDVVTSELSKSRGIDHALGPRIAELLGFGPSIGFYHPAATAEGALVLVVAVVVASHLARHAFLTMLDWAQLGIAGALLVIGLIPGSLPIGYTYFAAGFGLIVVGNAVGNVLSLIVSGSGLSGLSSTIASGLTVLFLAVMVTTLTVVVPKETHFEKSYFLGQGTSPASSIDRVVVTGSCVISNDPGDLIIAERFAQLPLGCPAIIDPPAVLSTALDRAAAASQWQKWMSEARYVVLSTAAPSVPWTPELTRFFSRNFDLVKGGPVAIYVVRDDPPA